MPHHALCWTVVFLVLCVCAPCCFGQYNYGLNRMLRVACRAGQSPYIDSVASPPSCSGILWEHWRLAAAQYGLNYTIASISYSAVDAVVVNATTNTSLFDLALSFTSISPDRLRTVDFTVPSSETDITLALSPKYKKSAKSMKDSVLRSSVMFLLAILAIETVGGATLFYIGECFYPESEMMERELWQRLLYCLEISIETAVTMNTGVTLVSQIARTTRVLIGIASLFILTIFGAVITSQLTTSTLSSVSPSVYDIRGARIMLSSNLYQPFLEGAAVGAKVVLISNIETEAAKFYSGERTDVDGYATSTDIVLYVHNKFAAGTDFVLSQPFTVTGAKEVKANLMSKLLPTSTSSAINQALQAKRDDGTVAQLFRDNIPSRPETDSDDVYIPKKDKTAVWVIVIVLLSLYGVALIASLAYRFIHGVVNKPDNESEPASPKPNTSGSNAVTEQEWEVLEPLWKRKQA